MLLGKWNSLCGSPTQSKEGGGDSSPVKPGFNQRSCKSRCLTDRHTQGSYSRQFISSHASPSPGSSLAEHYGGYILTGKSPMPTESQKWSGWNKRTFPEVMQRLSVPPLFFGPCSLQSPQNISKPSKWRAEEPGSGLKVWDSIVAGWGKGEVS